MTTAISIAEFRKDMRRFMDTALSGREVVCVDAKSRERHSCSFIKTNLLLDILRVYSFSPVIFFDEETKTYNAHLDELKLYAFADTKEEATEQLIDLAIDYARDYVSRLELFLNLPDRKGHYPYVLRLTHCQSRDEIGKMLFGGE